MALKEILTAVGVASGAAHLAPGSAAPDFKLPDTDGNTVTLKELLAKGPVLLAFFPKAFTPG